MGFSSQSHSALELVLSEDLGDGLFVFSAVMVNCDCWLDRPELCLADELSARLHCLRERSEKITKGNASSSTLAAGAWLAGRERAYPQHATSWLPRHQLLSALPCSSCHNGRKTKSQNMFCLLSSCYVSYSVTTMRLHLIHSDGWVFSCQLSEADSFASLSLPKA